MIQSNGTPIRDPRFIYNYRDMIRNPRYKDIVIVTLPSLIDRERAFNDPRLLQRNEYYTWNLFENYFRYDLQMDDVPVHYVVEKIGKDWAIITGCPSTTKSMYLQELIKFNVIHPYFNDAIAICVMDDWALEIPEQRMWKVLTHRLLSSLMYQYKIQREGIHFIDEIINKEAYKIAWETGKFHNRILPSTFYDRVALNMEITKYKKG